MSLKDEYCERMTSQFKRWDAEFGMLSDKAAEMGDAAAAQFGAQLQTMRADRDVASRNLHELRKAGESGWRRMQSDMDTTWDALKLSLQTALSRSRKLP